jgi:HTH-type transcriptional regulator/antitoxin HigA
MNVKNGNRTRRIGTAKCAGPIRPELKSLFVERGGGMRANARYLKLASVFPIRPLSSDADLDEAIRVVDRLLSRKKTLDYQEQGYLDSLSHEIERYEAANVTMPDVSGAAMLRHLIEARDITLSDVAASTGIAISTLSSVLRGNRELNRRHIEKLAPYFGVSPGVFIR